MPADSRAPVGCIAHANRKQHLGTIKSFPLLILLVFSQWLVRPASAEVGNQPFKVGFIMTGPVADQGWNYAHDQGRKFLENALKDKVQTIVAENVPENSQTERVMEKMIAQGCKLIFATSYGYLEPALKVASRHPDVIIMQCLRPCPHSIKNFGSYLVNLFGPMYVTGVVAGRSTKSDKIGCVAAFPVNSVMVTLNAFVIGVHSVKPKAKVQVVWTNSWFDPPTEAEATKGLIEAGADVIFSEVSSAAAVVQTAEKNGARSAGCCLDCRNLAPKGWLTGQCFNWGPLYVRTAQSVMNHTWTPGDHIYGMKDGYSTLASFGSMVPDSVKKEALATAEKVQDGKVIIFKGPIKDTDGKVRIVAGKIPDENYLLQMDWAIAGVEGSIPKK